MSTEGAGSKAKNLISATVETLASGSARVERGVYMPAKNDLTIHDIPDMNGPILDTPSCKGSRGSLLN